MSLQENRLNNTEYESNFLSIKEAIVFPNKTAFIEQEGDEIGLCYFPKAYSDPLAEIMKLCSWSRYAAEDRRQSSFAGREVGCIDLNHRLLSRLIWEFYEDGLVAPRKKVIDQNSQLIKLVGVVVIGWQGNVLLVTREKEKTILPKAATVSVMESFTLEDIALLFLILNPELISSGPAPHAFNMEDNYFRPDFHLNERPLVEKIIFRGAKEECPEIREKRLSLFCLVGGAKDLGLVWYYEADQDEFERLARIHSGIIINPKIDNYYDCLRELRLNPDGWTEAILKYLSQSNLVSAT